MRYSKKVIAVLLGIPATFFPDATPSPTEQGNTLLDAPLIPKKGQLTLF